MQVGEGAGLCGEGDVAGVGLHIGNHGFHVFELLVGAVADKGVGIVKHRHAGQFEIIQHVEGFIHAHDLRDGGAAVIEHETVAVVGVAQHVFKGNGASAAGHVGHDHVPAHFFGQGRG